MTLRSALAAAGTCLTIHLLNPTPLTAQTARDTLLLGRRAYERVDFPAAARLLAIGLTAGGSASDTLWVGGVHMLTDALLEAGQDSLAALWARWSLRLAPGFPVDANFPPRVTRVLAAARTAVGATPAADTLANTAWDESGDTVSSRGTLRIQRGGQGLLALVEGVGTMLPGESRGVPAGSYTIRLTADGFQPLTVVREVLPGYATVITPRLVRPGGTTAAAASVAAAPASAPATNAPPVRGAGLAAGGASSCAVVTATLVCWGNNAVGQLGSGAADSAQKTPATLRSEAAFVAVSAGATHTCALTREARAWCWGLGGNGELGNGQLTSSATPVPVSGGQLFSQVAAGGSHSCALSGTGTVYCWGSNRSGALGNRTSASSALPVTIAAPPNVSFTQITAGNGHSCALASNGTAWCWGSNVSGQLGNGVTADANTPVAVQSTVPFRSVVAGGTHTCALTAAGAAWCWGANTAGQLGTGSAVTDSPRPVPVTGALALASLAAGDSHTCGLTEDGAAYCWGFGRSGQLGNGQSGDSPRPALVVGGHVLRALALGSAHSCATRDDGTVWCWGANSDGQTGSVGGRGTAVPVPVLIRPAPIASASGGTTVAPPTSQNLSAPSGTASAAAPSAPAVTPTTLRESFADGNYTAAPAWRVDSAGGLRIAVADSALDISRTSPRSQVAAAGVTLPVRIPVTRATQIEFDVLVRTGGLPCGLNCANYPAIVRLRARNSDLTESEVWYAFGDRGGQSRTLGGVAIVAKGDAVAGTWLRGQRFTIRDALPRADTIIGISLGGVGAEFAARFDNLRLPVPVAVALDITPDSASFTAAAASQRLHAVVREAGGTEMAAPVAWSSSDTAVARVDSTGLVTAVGNGHAVVRGRFATVADSAIVTVRLAPAARTPARRPARQPARRP